MSDRLTVRSHRSHFTIRLGPATTVGRLLPIRKPTAKDGKICSHDYTAVEQYYQDGDGKLWKPQDLPRGLPNKDGSFTPIDKDAVAEAKVSELPKDVLDLNIHSIKDVEGKIFPSDNNAYIFDTLQKDKKGVPIKEDPTNVAWHDFIYHVLDKGKVALLGRANFSGNEGLYQLTNYQGNLAIQRMLYPEELNQYEKRDISLTTAEKKKALAMVEGMVRDFDPEEYTNHTARKVAAIVEAGDFDPDKVIIHQQSAAPKGFDLMSALDSFETMVSK